jgi:hypothetical protein
MACAGVKRVGTPRDVLRDGEEWAQDRANFQDDFFFFCACDAAHLGKDGRDVDDVNLLTALQLWPVRTCVGNLCGRTRRAESASAVTFHRMTHDIFLSKKETYNDAANVGGFNHLYRVAREEAVGHNCRHISGPGLEQPLEREKGARCER